MPPETIENSVEVRLATAPDSKSPSRGPPVTTAIWIAEMRLRYSSVIEVCKMVLRSTVEMTSIAPATARQTRPTQRTVHETEERHDDAPREDDQDDQSAPPRHPIHPAGEDRHDQCARARGGVEQAEDLGTAVVHVLRHRGEERSRQPEDHGVEVDEVDGLDERVAVARR